MPHVLIGGDQRLAPAVSDLLRQWGMTCSELLDAGQGANRPTIAECDAVILCGCTREFLVPSSEGAAPTAPEAPYILLGNNPGSLLLSRDAWRVLPDQGSDAVDLKFAVLSCLEESSRRRGGAPQENQAEGYWHFLGHELRSPLTAAKTALEVLQGELGGVQSGADAPANNPNLRMLNIALRNIKRLHHTVDWSQDLHEMQRVTGAAGWGLVPVAQLQNFFDKNVPLAFEPTVSDLTLETAPPLLQVLLGQLTRVLEFVAPGSNLRGQVCQDEHQPRTLVLSLQPAGEGDGQLGPRINRTHLTSQEDGSECEPQEELELLTNYVVSGQLLDRLQAKVQAVAGSRGLPTLELRLVCASDSSFTGVEEDQPGVLHAPA